MSLKDKNCSNKSTIRRSRTAIRINSVEFHNNTQVFFVPGLWEFSQEEIEATWISEEDTANIQHNTLKTLKRMRKGRIIDEEKYSVRGLEHMASTDHLEKRRINKASVINAVLAEQKRQRKSGRCDPKEISNQSTILSEKSRVAALRMGASDAAVAGIQVKRELSRSGDKVTAQKNEPCSSYQHIESNGCMLIQDDAIRLNNPAKSSQLNKLNEPCLPSDKLWVERKVDAARSIIEKADGCVERDSSKSVFNRVFSKLSLGLEGEVNHTKMKTNEMISSSSPPQGMFTKPNIPVSKLA